MTRQSRETSSSVLIAGIEHLVTLVEAEVQEMERQQPHPLPMTKGGEFAPEEARSLDELDLLVVHLRQISDTLHKYPRLLPLVDDYIGKQVRAMEQRQSRQNIGLAIITTLIGALLGWGVSLLGTPASVLHLFIH